MTLDFIYIYIHLYLYFYDIIFGELRFHSKSLTVTLQIVKSLRFEELAVNSSSPIFSVFKLWRVIRNFMLQNVFISLQHVLQNTCCFCVDLILYLFISHV